MIRRLKSLNDRDKYYRLKKWKRKKASIEHLCRLCMGWIGIGDLYLSNDGSRAVCLSCFKTLKGKMENE